MNKLSSSHHPELPGYLLDTKPDEIEHGMVRSFDGIAEVSAIGEIMRLIFITIWQIKSKLFCVTEAKNVGGRRYIDSTVQKGKTEGVPMAFLGGLIGDDDQIDIEGLPAGTQWESDESGLLKCTVPMSVALWYLINENRLLGVPIMPKGFYTNSAIANHFSHSKMSRSFLNEGSVCITRFIPMDELIDRVVKSRIISEWKPDLVTQIYNSYGLRTYPEEQIVAGLGELKNLSKEKLQTKMRTVLDIFLSKPEDRHPTDW